MNVRRLWRRTKGVLVHRVLRLDDSPHRIALGVFLGFVVGWTPTMGLQILIFLAIAAMCRANKVAGIVPIILTNPITAIPIYVFNWRIGSLLLRGDTAVASAAQVRLKEKFESQPGLTEMLSHLFEASFWRDLWEMLMSMGGELWLGCLVVGVITGTVGYIATYFAVQRYQRNHEQRLAKRRRAAKATAVAI